MTSKLRPKDPRKSQAKHKVFCGQRREDIHSSSNHSFNKYFPAPTTCQGLCSGPRGCYTGDPGGQRPWLTACKCWRSVAIWGIKDVCRPPGDRTRRWPLSCESPQVSASVLLLRAWQSPKPSHASQLWRSRGELVLCVNSQAKGLWAAVLITVTNGFNLLGKSNSHHCVVTAWLQRLPPPSCLVPPKSSKSLRGSWSSGLLEPSTLTAHPHVCVGLPAAPWV